MHRLKGELRPLEHERAAWRIYKSEEAVKAAPPPPGVMTPEAAQRRDQQIAELQDEVRKLARQVEVLNVEKLKANLASIACLGCPKMRDT
jgi:hypothetical protein